MKDDQQRFWEKVEEPFDVHNDCWLWIAGKASHGGYGVFWPSRQKPIYAHRFAYECLSGQIPEGFEIDHLCRTPACVNPSHLEAVTHRINIQRSPIMGQANSFVSHCPAGHLYEGANLYVNPKTGRRSCRACKREWARKHRHLDS